MQSVLKHHAPCVERTLLVARLALKLCDHLADILDDHVGVVRHEKEVGEGLRVAAAIQNAQHFKQLLCVAELAPPHQEWLQRRLGLSVRGSFRLECIGGILAHEEHATAALAPCAPGARRQARPDAFDVRRDNTQQLDGCTRGILAMATHYPQVAHREIVCGPVPARIADNVALGDAFVFMRLRQALATIRGHKVRRARVDLGCPCGRIAEPCVVPPSVPLHMDSAPRFVNVAAQQTLPGCESLGALHRRGRCRWLQ
mmetsp:Transcript_10017/g.41528  ORF Transcript_10017/g.41528 Transcript_10017/m.41528 type:complete len:257 (-) Transcript_10017:2019-2789(-)